MADPSYTSAQTITPGTPVSPSKGILISAQSEGKVSLVMQNGTRLQLYVFPGTFQFDGISVKDVDMSGTTATVSVVALYRDA